MGNSILRGGGRAKEKLYILYYIVEDRPVRVSNHIPLTVAIVEYIVEYIVE